DTNSSASGNQNTLSFSTSNWETEQTVTVSGVDDDNASPETVKLSHSAAGGNYGLVTEDLVVTVTDDDTPGLVLSATEVTVKESGSATYGVKLATEPTAAVTVTVGGMDSGLSVDTNSPALGNQNTLRFSTSNWKTEQTVMVYGVNDDNASPEMVTLSHTAIGGDYSVTADLVVTVTDDDTPGLVISPAVVPVAEAGSATYTVKLATEPTAAVTVTLSSMGSGVSVDADDGIPGKQTTLSFSPSNWDKLQTVAVRAATDDNTSSEEVTVSHTAAGADYDSVSKNLRVTVIDNDTPGLLLFPEAVTVAEAGVTTYRVQLVKEPTEGVTVTVRGMGSVVSVDADGGMPGEQTTLSFTTTDWNTAQTVTISAADDANATSETVTLSHTASGGDYESLSKELSVTVTENDTAGLVVSPETVVVWEAGSATYTVKLASQPTDGVTVTVGGMGSDVRVDTDPGMQGDQTTLGFTTSNWDRSQTVTVHGVDDDDVISEAVRLRHTASGGDYDSVIQDLVFKVTDDDAAGLILSSAVLMVGEAGSATYTVRLASQPTEEVINISVSGMSGRVTVDTDPVLTGKQNRLTFFTQQINGMLVSNWETEQTVTVYGVDDDNASPETVILTHATTRGNYSVTEDLVVTVTDDDTAGLVVSSSALTVGEAGSTTYTVKLATEPTDGVTVTVGGTGTGVSVDTDGGMAGEQASLSFTTSNWQTEQTVTVSGVDDDDVISEKVTLSHSASGGDYGSVSQELVVTVTDDDNICQSYGKLSNNGTECDLSSTDITSL
ncbi:MAG: hypothetical protein TH68_09230, partial [Candidatus Synechococcus spongiarum 142]